MHMQQHRNSARGREVVLVQRPHVQQRERARRRQLGAVHIAQGLTAVLQPVRAGPCTNEATCDAGHVVMVIVQQLQHAMLLARARR
jgi:hypothetical protein